MQTEVEETSKLLFPLCYAVLDMYSMDIMGVMILCTHNWIQIAILSA